MTQRTPSERLTPAQFRHLRELHEVGEKAGTWEQSYWYPHGAGEHRSARALAALGLIEWLPSYGAGIVYGLTERGHEVIVAELVR